jgi:hypothetical protein
MTTLLVKNQFCRNKNKKMLIPGGHVVYVGQQPAWLLGSWVQILLTAWMFIFCVCCVLCRYWPLWWADHLFRVVLTDMRASNCVWLGLLRQRWSENYLQIIFSCMMWKVPHEQLLVIWVLLHYVGSHAPSITISTSTCYRQRNPFFHKINNHSHRTALHNFHSENVKYIT